jgi:hypothetical protein
VQIIEEVEESACDTTRGRRPPATNTCASSIDISSDDEDISSTRGARGANPVRVADPDYDPADSVSGSGSNLDLAVRVTSAEMADRMRTVFESSLRLHATGQYMQVKEASF